jgi:hypothetical protein
MMPEAYPRTIDRACGETDSEDLPLVSHIRSLGDDYLSETE